MLISSERREIVKLLAKKKSTLEIYKTLTIDHRIAKRFIDGEKVERKNRKEVVQV